MTPILSIILAYLLGSIPTSVWVGKAFYDVDIRKHGSKNAGATNTFRVLGKPAGFFVFIVDVAKGFFAVWFVDHFADFEEDWLNSSFKVIGAVAAVLGHVFPIFAGFKGGKGVATAFGIIIALAPISAAVCFIVFLLFWLTSNFVSLGSLVAALVFPLVQMFLEPEQDDVMFAFSFLITFTVVLSHRRNIMRLLNGVEPKTYPFRKR